MKFSTTLIALVAAGLANAQLPNVPNCSLSCFVTALTTDGCSGLTDFACHCQKPALVSDITPCVQKACDVADQIAVSNAVVAQCSSAGHPISVPPVETATAASTTTTSSASSASATGSSSSASASGSGSSSSSAAGSTTTGSSGSSGSSSSSAGSAPAGSTPAGTSTPLASKTSGGASGATSSPVWTGAAVNIKGNMAGVAAVAAAAAYIL